MKIRLSVGFGIGTETGKQVHVHVGMQGNSLSSKETSTTTNLGPRLAHSIISRTRQGLASHRAPVNSRI